MDKKREPFTTAFRGYDKDEVLLYLKKQAENGAAEKKEQEQLMQAYQQLGQAYQKIEQAGQLCENEKQQMSARASKLQVENRSLLQELDQIILQARLTEGDTVIRAVTDIPDCDEEEQKYAKSAMDWVAYKIKQVQQAEGKIREKYDQTLEEAKREAARIEEEARREAARIESEGALRVEQCAQVAQKAWQSIVGILIEVDSQIENLQAKKLEYSEDIHNAIKVSHDAGVSAGKEIEGSCDAGTEDLREGKSM